MKNPENIPITPLSDKATLPEVIATLNKLIDSVNFMWDHTEPDHKA
jgi:hypothetical protein